LNRYYAVTKLFVTDRQNTPDTSYVTKKSLREAMQHIVHDKTADGYEVTLDASSKHYYDGGYDIHDIPKPILISSNTTSKASLLFRGALQLKLTGCKTKFQGIECIAESLPAQIIASSYNLEIQNCNFNNVSLNIHEYCNTTITDSEFLNIKDGSAIEVVSAKVSITNNYIHACTSGIYLFYLGWYTDSVVYEIGIPSSGYAIVTNNRISDCSESGMEIEYGYADKSQYKDNIIERCQTGIVHVIDQGKEEEPFVETTMQNNQILNCVTEKKIFKRGKPEWYDDLINW
jgi:hypothetical protein